MNEGLILAVPYFLLLPVSFFFSFSRSLEMLDLKLGYITIILLRMLLVRDPSCPGLTDF